MDRVFNPPNSQTVKLHTSKPHTPYVGRFAPSPTGPLHLGSLATALGSWLIARSNGGKWLLRIEDIDRERCKPEFTALILKALQAHGLNWDGEVWIQSQRHEIYAEHLARLNTEGLAYPCACTRKEIDAANAHRGFGENRIYPGTCAQGMPAGKVARAVRFRCPKEAVTWTDQRLGSIRDNLQESSGDFVLKRGDGYWAYHLVVVVDDFLSGVTHIVRGEDLADTTARQIALYRALKAEPPSYWHLPVIMAEDGQKLSKQTGAQGLDLNQAIENLNRVWSHLGFKPFQAKTPDKWLETALHEVKQNPAYLSML